RHAILLEAVVLHPALDVQPVALADVLLRDLGEPVPEGETMPLGPLLAVAVLPGHAVARRERAMRDAHTAGRGLDIGIPADVPDANDLVAGSAHECLPWGEFASGDARISRAAE